MDIGVESLRTDLRFVGNWFIDAGILGFVNLMSEVYDWNLEELRMRIAENSDLIYYGYFPFAYLYYHSKIMQNNKEISTIMEDIKKLKDKKKEKINKLSESINDKQKEKLRSDMEEINKDIIDKEQNINELRNKFIVEKRSFQKKIGGNILFILDNVSDNIGECRSKIEEIILDFNLNLPADHRNFYLYNPKKDLFNSFLYLYYLLKEDYSAIRNIKNKEPTYEIYPDSTIIPFLFSPSGFSNISYTKPLSIQAIKYSLKLNIPPYLLLLSLFSHAFTYFLEKKIIFYTNDLEISYNISKRIKNKIEKVKEPSIILKITWDSIFEELVEKKAKFSLENMYLIQFSTININNQKIENVEYIGMPKLQATIILDDTVRESLSVSFILYRGNKKIYIYLIEEFLKGRSLLPYLLEYARQFLKENRNQKNISIKTLVYATAVDSEIKAIVRDKSLFSEDFLRSYRNVLINIKEEADKILKISSIISKLYVSDEKNRLATKLLSSVVKTDKYVFSNILLKSINKKNERGDEIGIIVNFIFKDIILNDINWEHYAFSVIIGLIKGGIKNGEIEE